MNQQTTITKPKTLLPAGRYERHGGRVVYRIGQAAGRPDIILLEPCGRPALDWAAAMLAWQRMTTVYNTD